MTLHTIVALFLIASCLSLPTPTLSQASSVLDNPDWSCPTGFFAVQDFGPMPPTCKADPCFGNPGPCGAGNKCTAKPTSISGRTFFESVCTCPAPSVVAHIVYKDFCYTPGTDRCNPNPCKNGGTCSAVTDFNGGKGAFSCSCPSNLQGTTCELPAPSPDATPRTATTPPTPPPTPTPTSGPITGDQGVCGQPGEAFGFPQRCWFNNDPRGRYVCCDNQGCDGFNADNLIPHCKNFGHVPSNFGEKPAPPTTGNQGVCGSGAASAFPLRCWYNNDPQGRYVCCDNDGCNGFYSDNLFPRCKTNGFVPPNL